ncbi:MAG: four helix bundle protein [Ferruginibacter sp.]
MVEKSYSFALQIIGIYKFLISEKKEFVLSKQLLRCGTSFGANIYEAVASESKRDFIHKLGISLKESRETSYWLQLLKDSEYINPEQFLKLNTLCDELIRILNSIILTTKERYFKAS